MRWIALDCGASRRSCPLLPGLTCSRPAGPAMPGFRGVKLGGLARGGLCVRASTGAMLEDRANDVGREKRRTTRRKRLDLRAVGALHDDARTCR